jgi:hypothetical protein
MKNLSKILVFTVLSVFLVAGSAMAVPTIPPTGGYTWADNPYWTPTDLTTGVDGESCFMIRVENAVYESDFGLYTVDDISSATKSIVRQFEIFSKNNDEVGAYKNVYFKQTGANWDITTDNISDLDNVTWTSFDNKFGFYYGVYAGGMNDPSLDYTYYSDSQFNTEDKGDQHVAVEWNGVSSVNIYLEDLRSEDADWDWQDMTILGSDLAPAPVPEPGTMLLLGSGLVGLAGFGRKKFFKKG